MSFRWPAAGSSDVLSLSVVEVWACEVWEASLFEEATEVIICEINSAIAAWEAGNTSAVAEEPRRD